MTLYQRLSSYYFFYFAALGALIPFWGLYLQQRGISAAAIGGLMAILTATKIIAPVMWGWITDHYGRRMFWVQIAALFAALTFSIIYWVATPFAIAMTMFTFGLFWNASLPQFDAVALNHLGQHSNRYAQLRVWGSIGFMTFVMALGPSISIWSIDIIPSVVLLLFIGVWISTLFVPDCKAAALHLPQPSIWQLLARREIRWFLFTCTLMQFSHGSYYAFYSIALTDAGYDSNIIGVLWALGVMVEVGVFMRMHWLLERFGAWPIMLTSLLLATVRWSAIGLMIDSPVIQVIVQTFHAATFGAFHAAAIDLVHHYFPGRTQGRGQALYNSVGFGIGGAAGSLIAGLIWTAWGATATFLIAALAALFGTLSGYRCSQFAQPRG